MGKTSFINHRENTYVIEIYSDYYAITKNCRCAAALLTIYEERINDKIKDLPLLLRQGYKLTLEDCTIKMVPEYVSKILSGMFCKNAIINANKKLKEFSLIDVSVRRDTDGVEQTFITLNVDKIKSDIATLQLFEERLFLPEETERIVKERQDRKEKNTVIIGRDSECDMCSLTDFDTLTSTGHKVNNDVNFSSNTINSYELSESAITPKETVEEEKESDKKGNIGHTYFKISETFYKRPEHAYIIRNEKTDFNIAKHVYKTLSTHLNSQNESCVLDYFNKLLDIIKETYLGKKTYTFQSITSASNLVTLMTYLETPKEVKESLVTSNKPVIKPVTTLTDEEAIAISTAEGYRLYKGDDATRFFHIKSNAEIKFGYRHPQYLDIIKHYDTE